MRGPRWLLGHVPADGGGPGPVRRAAGRYGRASVVTAAVWCTGRRAAGAGVSRSLASSGSRLKPRAPCSTPPPRSGMPRCASSSTNSSGSARRAGTGNPNVSLLTRSAARSIPQSRTPLAAASSVEAAAGEERSVAGGDRGASNGPGVMGWTLRVSTPSVTGRHPVLAAVAGPAEFGRGPRPGSVGGRRFVVGHGQARDGDGGGYEWW
jgi:hypothetical protein